MVLHAILSSPYVDTSPNSLRDSIANPKVKTMEGEGVWVHTLVHSILGVEGHARVL
jgi:hypothetical protein